MPVKQLDADSVGLPKFVPAAGAEGSLFDLSSHARAREALEVGLAMKDPGFNIFVVGEDRSGRMTETLAFLSRSLKDLPVADDWVYLNNFRRTHRPRPVRLPAGVGRVFRDRLASVIANLHDSLVQAFGGDEFRHEVERAGESVHGEINREMETLRSEAAESGLTILQTPQGVMVAALDEEGKPVGIDTVPEDRRQALQSKAEEIGKRLGEISRRAARLQADLAESVIKLRRQVADQAVGAILEPVVTEFGKYPGLNRWLISAREDILDHLDLFRGEQDGARMPGTPAPEPPERRYAVNLLVDHGDETELAPVVESNPTYENLFGRIEYRSTGGYLDTDFTLIRSGALHRANGGILVIRAEAIAAHPTSWQFLKGALRDGCIRIEELYRYGGAQITGSPSPKPIPLDVKVVIVGAPLWYYAFFTIDREFRAYFKIKADIDTDMEADEHNIAVYSRLVRRAATTADASQISDEAVARMLGQCSRWAADRTRLTAQGELVADTMAEAAHIAAANGHVVDLEIVEKAIERRRRRNSRIEDRSQEAIARGTILIDTAGDVVGQVNGLTVRDMGDHAFGGAARITARASVGRAGVINIERHVALGGPIQQKGVMVLYGYLTGRFARAMPVAFNCSITFEQSYGGVEGDSASLAELLAILSDLAQAPLRQDLAITGSVNQLGRAQAIGGAHHKVEGFYRTCAEAGLTGSQGAVVPKANERNLVLRDEVAEAVEGGRFHLYSVETIEEAAALFTGLEIGEPDGAGLYPPDTLYGRVQQTLAGFDRILAERERGMLTGGQG